jgi:hypothetical protein
VIAQIRRTSAVVGTEDASLPKDDSVSHLESDLVAGARRVGIRLPPCC